MSRDSIDSGSTNAVVSKGPKIRVITWVTFVIAVLLAFGLGTRYYLHQDFNVFHVILSLFFSVNMLICYWEMCLYLRRTYIETRTEFWKRHQEETGELPYMVFFASKIPLTKVFSTHIWADVWATYSQYDPSFANRKSFGFSVDSANGFVTLIPTAFLYAATTIYFLPARLAGIVGLMAFWQWTYMTSTYFLSFFVAKRHHAISRRDLYLLVFGTNGFWVVLPLVGLYVSYRLVVDGNYGILM